MAWKGLFFRISETKVCVPQYNKAVSGNPLPHVSVRTGKGYERPGTCPLLLFSLVLKHTGSHMELHASGVMLQNWTGH